MVLVLGAGAWCLVLSAWCQVLSAAAPKSRAIAGRGVCSQIRREAADGAYRVDRQIPHLRERLRGQIAAILGIEQVVLLFQ